MSSVAAVLFTAIGISFVAIALHGSLRVPDDLFTDEIEVRNPTQEVIRCCPVSSLHR